MYHIYNLVSFCCHCLCSSLFQSYRLLSVFVSSHSVLQHLISVDLCCLPLFIALTTLFIFFILALIRLSSVSFIFYPLFGVSSFQFFFLNFLLNPFGKKRRLCEDNQLNFTILLGFGRRIVKIKRKAIFI